MRSISQLVKKQLINDYPYDDEYTLRNVIDSLDKVSEKYKAIKKVVKNG